MIMITYRMQILRNIGVICCLSIVIGVIIFFQIKITNTFIKYIDGLSIGIFLTLTIPLNIIALCFILVLIYECVSIFIIMCTNYTPIILNVENIP
jgi:hypothetical protein